MESVRMVLIASRAMSCSAPRVMLIGLSCQAAEPLLVLASRGGAGRWCFQRGHLAQATQVPLGSTELGPEERLNQVPGHRRALGPAAETQNVHVIVLDSLPSGKVVVDQRRADAGNLVGTDGSADPAAADGDPTLHRAVRHRAGEGDDEVGVVVVRVQTASAEVHDVVPEPAKAAEQILLQVESAVIGGDANAHARLSASGCQILRGLIQAAWPAAARSARTKACSWRTRPAGMDRSPLRRRSNILTLSPPVTSHRIRRERLSIGYVRVIRRRP